MWFKTQNSKVLVYANIIKADETPNVYGLYPIWTLVNENPIGPRMTVTLGEYKTSEQSMFVLDNISETIASEITKLYVMPSITSTERAMINAKLYPNKEGI